MFPKSTAKLIPMETEYPYAPGAHRKAFDATAGNENRESECGDTLETLCEGCLRNTEKAIYVFEREDENGRQWKSTVMAKSVGEARKTLSNWAGKALTHIYIGGNNEFTR